MAQRGRGNPGVRQVIEEAANDSDIQMAGSGLVDNPDDNPWGEKFATPNRGHGQMSRVTEPSYDSGDAFSYWWSKHINGNDLDEIQALHKKYPDVFDKLSGGGEAPDGKALAELNKIIAKHPENADKVMANLRENKWMLDSGGSNGFSLSQEDMRAVINDPSLMEFKNLNTIANDPELGPVFHHMRKEMGGAGMSLAEAREMDAMFGEDMNKTRQVFSKIKENYNVFGDIASGEGGAPDQDMSKAMMKMAFKDPSLIDTYAKGKEWLSNDLKNVVGDFFKSLKDGNLDQFFEKFMGMLEDLVGGLSGKGSIVNGSNPDMLNTLANVAGELVQSKLGKATNDDQYNNTPNNIPAPKLAG